MIRALLAQPELALLERLGALIGSDRLRRILRMLSYDFRLITSGWRFWATSGSRLGF